MSPLKHTLAQLEARLQALVENGAARLLPGGRPPQDLGARLAEAMRSGVQHAQNGATLAPNLYVILAPAGMAAALESNPALLDELRRVLQQTGEQAGLTFSGPVALRIVSEPRLAPGELRVQASHSLEGISETNDLTVSPSEDPEALPQGAFLIVDGVRIFPLEQRVVNIGRRPDNHLAIDDPRVSRLHAQLRAMGGRYVIFDLDSGGGTWVNGRRIRQQALAPGDVISLSGAPLVYGQEEPDPSQTQEMAPST